MQMNSYKVILRALIITMILIGIGIGIGLWFIQLTRTNPTDTVPPDEIICYTWTADAFLLNRAKAFDEVYGIPVRIVVNNADVYIRKALSESELPIGSMDCILANSSYQLGQLVEGGVVNTQQVEDTLKQQSFISGYSPLYRTHAGFLYDSTLLPDHPVTWDEFVSWIENNPERFGFTVSGSDAGCSIIYALLSHMTGGGDQYSCGDTSLVKYKTALWNDVWQKFIDNREDVLYISSDHDALRLISSGKIWLTSAMEHQVLQEIKAGRLPSSVKMYIPEFGAVSDTYGMVIPKNSPHHESTKKFVEFLTSEQSLKVMEEMLCVESASPLYRSGRERLIPYKDLEYTLLPPDAVYYRMMVNSFKDNVLYH